MGTGNSDRAATVTGRRLSQSVTVVTMSFQVRPHATRLCASDLQYDKLSVNIATIVIQTIVRGYGV